MELHWESILFRLTKNFILMNEISENTLNEELNRLFLVKARFRENYTRLGTTWRSKIWNEECQNTQYLSHNVSLKLKDDNYWKPNNWQIKLNMREHTCIADWRCLHQESYARSCREIEELKRRCYQKENTEKQRRLEEFPTQHDQESRTVSLLRDQVRRLQERWEYIEHSKIFHDPDSPSSCDSAYVSHQALISSSYKKTNRESRMQRNTRENMSTPGNVFDCQHARRDPDEFHNDSRNLAISSAILRTEGIEKSEKQRIIANNTFTLLFGKSKGKSLDDRNFLMSMTNHAAGIGTCTRSGMTIPSHLSGEMHLQKIPDQTEFQSWVENFRAEVCAKAKNLALTLQWIKEIEAAAR